ncbi:hypothetical protein L6452_16444 [Arctium lappa]|uniref:Uncharacterized protein n=1 Tax=Arctium lappa TaxID=4217 RepID=A0ACB9C0V0_ARCLA|nr:hypothetical protein L6452_16444 [Arctium lappa]
MLPFFKQFGEIKRIRIARNKKTGKSKHFGFLEFASPEVAKIVAETMHNYLLFEHLLQVQLIPPERVHPKLNLEVCVTLYINDGTVGYKLWDEIVALDYPAAMGEGMRDHIKQYKYESFYFYSTMTPSVAY